MSLIPSGKICIMLATHNFVWVVNFIGNQKLWRS